MIDTGTTPCVARNKGCPVSWAMHGIAPTAKDEIGSSRETAALPGFSVRLFAATQPLLDGAVVFPNGETYA
jgi:hypothetical protein